MPVGGTTMEVEPRAGTSAERAAKGRRLAWIAIGMIALAAAAFAGFALIPGPWHSAANRGPKALVLPGVVEVQEVRLGSKVGGRVREVHILEGDRVEAGAPLVTLDVPELEAQQAQWRAKLRSDLAALEKAKNGPRREEIAAAAAEVAAAEARHDAAEAGLPRGGDPPGQERLAQCRGRPQARRGEPRPLRALLRRNSTTQSQVDMARADFDRARGRAAGVRAHYDLVMRGNRPEEVAEAAAQLDQARANLDLLKAGTRAEDIAMLEAQAEQTRARLREVEVNLAEAVVRAPGKAFVDIVSVRKGDLVSPGQAVGARAPGR